MEIFNKNRVELPELPAVAGKKLRLAHEVAGRIVETMNRNRPSYCDNAWLEVTHHGTARTDVHLYLTDGPDSYKSGSKIVEAVAQALSGISCIRSVSIFGLSVTSIGRFAP